MTDGPLCMVQLPHFSEFMPAYVIRDWFSMGVMQHNWGGLNCSKTCQHVVEMAKPTIYSKPIHWWPYWHKGDVNRPISFFCGDQCTNVPSGVGSCEILEQLPPCGGLGQTVCYCSTEDKECCCVCFTLWLQQRAHLWVSDVHITLVLKGMLMHSYNVYLISTDFCWVEADKSILYTSPVCSGN